MVRFDKTSNGPYIPIVHILISSSRASQNLPRESIPMNTVWNFLWYVFQKNIRSKTMYVFRLLFLSRPPKRYLLFSIYFSVMKEKGQMEYGKYFVIYILSYIIFVKRVGPLPGALLNFSSLFPLLTYLAPASK